MEYYHTLMGSITGVPIEHLKVTDWVDLLHERRLNETIDWHRDNDLQSDPLHHNHNNNDLLYLAIDQYRNKISKLKNSPWLNALPCDKIHNNVWIQSEDNLLFDAHDDNIANKYQPMDTLVDHDLLYTNDSEFLLLYNLEKYDRVLYKSDKWLG